MRILNEQKASNIRKNFINSMINKNSEYYINNIHKLHSFKDGFCYIGYLWDCFNSFEQKDESYCLNYIESLDEIYVMWDIHSCERIFIPDYWKYPKESIIALSHTEYIKLKNSFPEDIYIFDSSFSWCCALTHESDEDGNRYCLFAKRDQ